MAKFPSIPNLNALPTPKTIGKTLLTTTKRLGKTASVAGLSALRVASGEKPDAQLLKETFENLGVTYIKLGQFIASTPTLFPKEYVIAFADCLDQTTPINFHLVQEILATELKHLGNLEDIFSHIDPKPLASASIAQVHKAVLKTGETVALKVQKPNVATIMQTDLGVLHGIFWAMEKTVPNFKMTNLAPIVDEIKKRMLAETDFVAESMHLKKFHQFLQSTNNNRIVVPTVFEHLTTKKVLTMSFFDGVSLIDEAVFGKLADPTKIMSEVLDTWFLSLMMTGEFHADLHAGNVMLLKNGQIGFLDFGLVGSIDPISLQACFALVEGVQRNDYHKVATAMANIGMTSQKVNIDYLADDIKYLLSQTLPTATDTRHQANNLHNLMADFGEIGKRHGIHFPRDFALLTKQLLYFDRFMVALAPEMDMFGDSRLNIIQQNQQ